MRLFLERMEPWVEVKSAQRLLRSLSDSSVAAVILDPPSRLREEAQHGVDHLVEDYVELAEEVRRVLIPGGASIFMGNPKSTSAWELVTEWEGLCFAAEITVLWLRNGRKYLKTLSTPVRWHTKPGLRFGPTVRVEVESNVVVCSDVDFRDAYCPTQRPVELFNYLISLLTCEGLIVDPFCGTGSALVAAQMCGREWIGGDIDENQALRARSRLQHLELEEAHMKPLYLWSGGLMQPVEG